MATVGIQRYAFNLTGDTSFAAGTALTKQANAEKLGPGYGVRFIHGAEFVSRLQVTVGTDSYDIADPSEFRNGNVIPLPEGFQSVRVYGWSDNPNSPTNLARVVLDVYTAPIAFVAAQPPRPAGLIMPMKTALQSGGRLHPRPGETLHVSIPATSAVVIASFVGDDYFDGASVISTNRSRTRLRGEEHGALIDVPGFFLHGFVAKKAAEAINLWFLSPMIDSNGNVAGYVTLTKLLDVAFTQLTNSATVDAVAPQYKRASTAFDDYCAFTVSGLNTANPIVVPPQGIVIVAENTTGAAIEIIGQAAIRGS